MKIRGKIDDCFWLICTKQSFRTWFLIFNISNPYLLIGLLLFIVRDGSSTQEDSNLNHNQSHSSRNSNRSVCITKSSNFRSNRLQSTQSYVTKNIQDPHSRAHSNRFNSKKTTTKGLSTTCLCL